jgi:hypothetical protein
MQTMKIPTYAHKPHLRFSRDLWRTFEHRALQIIDATCGQGFDTLILRDEALAPHGRLIALDIQPEALEKTFKAWNSHPCQKPCTLTLHNLCHSHIDQIADPGSVDLIVYNLGYLPHSDKQATTLAETTLTSANKALNLLADSGMITFTVYPGHAAGEVESAHLSDWIKQLDPRKFQILKLEMIGQKRAPYVIVIQKRNFSC